MGATEPQPATAVISQAQRWHLAAELMARLNRRCRSVWIGDDGSLRCGRSGDVVTMLNDLRIPERS